MKCYENILNGERSKCVIYEGKRAKIFATKMSLDKFATIIGIDAGRTNAVK